MAAAATVPTTAAVARPAAVTDYAILDYTQAAVAGRILLPVSSAPAGHGGGGQGGNSAAPGYSGGHIGGGCGSCTGGNVGAGPNGDGPSGAFGAQLGGKPGGGVVRWQEVEGGMGGLARRFGGDSVFAALARRDADWEASFDETDGPDRTGASVIDGAGLVGIGGRSGLMAVRERPTQSFDDTGVVSASVEIPLGEFLKQMPFLRIAVCNTN